MIETLIALFWGVCVSSAPVDAPAQMMDWNRDTGWNLSGYFIDEGFHAIDGGHIRILRRAFTEDYYVFGTDRDVPGNPFDIWHVQCHGYSVAGEDLP